MGKKWPVFRDAAPDAPERATSAEVPTEATFGSAASDAERSLFVERLKRFRDALGPGAPGRTGDWLD